MLEILKEALIVAKNSSATGENLLIGRQIENSPIIEGLIRDLVDEVNVKNQGLFTISPPIESCVPQAQKKLQQTGILRGRPLYHNYMGTGAGRGPFVELEDGSVKLDLINGIGIHILGHAHPRLIKAAVRGALSDIVVQGNLQPNNEYLKLSERLVQIASRKSRLKHAWFATCGTMANETALKIARQKHSSATHSPRMIMAMKNAFAGRSTMMAELTDNVAYKQGLPDYNEVLRIPNHDKRDPQSGEKALKAMKDYVAKHPKDISCFVFEPMLGEGGFQPVPREFYVPLLEFCKQNNIAVWADEVQTFMRTGEFFAFETMDLGQYVDIVTVAKTLQLAATLYTQEYNPKPGLIAGTFSGTTSSMTVGLEILDILEEGFIGPMGRIHQIHKRFVDGLNYLGVTTCKGQVHDAGGMGLMIAFTPFDGKKEQVEALIKKLFTNGVIAFSCGKDPVRIRMLVPAIIMDQEIDLALEIIGRTIQQGI